MGSRDPNVPSLLGGRNSRNLFVSTNDSDVHVAARGDQIGFPSSPYVSGLHAIDIDNIINNFLMKLLVHFNIAPKAIIVQNVTLAPVVHEVSSDLIGNIGFVNHVPLQSKYSSLSFHY
jgi:hypothetical protein